MALLLRIGSGALALPGVLVLVLGLASTAQAFDVGPHSDLTRDALGAEGFGATAADIANAGSWFVDLYSNAKASADGHSGALPLLLGKAWNAPERWPASVVDAAASAHFDVDGKRLKNAVGLEAEWQRLARATGSAARLARDKRRPLELLLILGISLHQVQDFYAHSNWIEPSPSDGERVAGADGPEWNILQRYGETPTWFDVPANVRTVLPVYVGGSDGHARGHGEWNADQNQSLQSAVAKDWPGRPGYAGAYTTAYFASRQWISALRLWVNDKKFWAQAQRYAKRYGAALNHDLQGAEQISSYSGRWQGQGAPCPASGLCSAAAGPGGNLLALQQAVRKYFAKPRSTFRKRFESLAVDLAAARAGAPAPSPQPSTELQQQTRFVRLQVTQVRSIDLGDPAPDQADLYARATLAGQPFLSGQINNQNVYTFPAPNAPFAFIKAIERSANFGKPVQGIQVEIRTSKTRAADTDDNVYLSLGGRLIFPLDKPAYDDFERGARDRYSVPIDAAVRRQLAVGDLTLLRIEKGSDGPGGSWKLGGVKLQVDGKTVYQNDRIERWLKRGRLSWKAPKFTAGAPLGQTVPVALDIYDSNGGLDQHGDLDPFGLRSTIALPYLPDAPIDGTAAGGSYLSPAKDPGQATLRYRLDTLTPVTTFVPGGVPPPQPIPDGDASPL